MFLYKIVTRQFQLIVIHKVFPEEFRGRGQNDLVSVEHAPLVVVEGNVRELPAKAPHVDDFRVG